MRQFPEGLLAVPENEVEGRFYRWLAADAGPDDWHRFALGANWDMHEPDLFEWIADQPDCDKATALALFWMANPDFLMEQPAVPDDFRKLVETIRQRWLAGGYSRSELAFDPGVDAWFPDFESLRSRFGARVEEELPLSMRQPLRGRLLNPAHEIEGIPARFWPEGLR